MQRMWICWALGNKKEGKKNGKNNGNIQGFYRPRKLGCC